jgi:phospholipid/cholesterol/gamma-HCH transport system substrate-binding protein
MSGRAANRWRRRLLLLLVPVLALVLGGCQGAYDLPLPGGVANGGAIYRVTVQFADVLDLVPQSAVKVGDVTVGSVESIDLQGWTAVVRLRLLDTAVLPDNATAELGQTSLLGEKYVALQAPTGIAPVGRLSDGDLIPLARSGRNPEVEEVLGALSLLLNGGGVGQLKIITTELNKALGGNEKSARDLLARLDTLVGSLDAQKADIVRAIDAIDRLATRLSAQRQDIAVALDQVPGGLKVLADQRAQLTTLLTSLARLGTVGTKVVEASRADTVANLTALQPVLAALNEAGNDLPDSLQLLLTYPFPDQALTGVKGDYTNLHITAELGVGSLLALGSRPPSTSIPGLPSLPSLPIPSLPTLPSLPGLPTVTCTLAPGVKLPVPGSSCPTVLPTTPTITCRQTLTGLTFAWPFATCPAGSTKVTPAPAPTPSPTTTGGGGTCVLGVCVGQAAPSSYDPALARLMLGGVGA